MYLIPVDHFDYFLLSVIDNTLDCIERATEGECGEVAAKHNRQIHSLYFQPEADLSICPPDKCKFCILLAVIGK